jgi:hypothetical protein
MALLHLVSQTQANFPASLRLGRSFSYVLRCLLRGSGAVLMLSPMCLSTSGLGGPGLRWGGKASARVDSVSGPGALATTAVSLWRILCAGGNEGRETSGDFEV